MYLIFPRNAELQEVKKKYQFKLITVILVSIYGQNSLWNYFVYFESNI